jgi:hypothetical protein
MGPLQRDIMRSVEMKLSRLAWNLSTGIKIPQSHAHKHGWHKFVNEYFSALAVKTLSATAETQSQQASHPAAKYSFSQTP